MHILCISYIFKKHNPKTNNVHCYRVNFVPQREICCGTLRSSESDFISNQGLCRFSQVKMTSLRWVLIPYNQCPYKREIQKQTDRERQCERHTECHVKTKDWGDTPTKKHPSSPAHNQTLGKGKGRPLWFSEGARTC